jgi:hypothetical protein
MSRGTDARDEDAIRTLVHRYAELIDHGDFAGVGVLFANATMDQGTGELLEGGDAIADSYVRYTRRYPDNGTPHTKHVTTNLIVEVDDDAGTATCRSYVVVHQQVDDFPLQPVWTNRYEDRFRRVDGVWEFAHRSMVDHMPGDTSRHLLQLPPG